MCQFNEVTDICQWPPVIRIISVLHSHRLSAGRSALSSQFRSAAVTIAVHRCGDEAGWWNKTGIDPTTAARVLWRETHPLPRTTGQPTAKLTNPMCRPALHEFLPQIEVNRAMPDCQVRFAGLLLSKSLSPSMARTTQPVPWHMKPAISDEY